MHELAVTRLINAQPAHVWHVMTERLAEWWCPRPWTTEIIRLDRRAGDESSQTEPLTRMIGQPQLCRVC